MTAAFVLGNGVSRKQINLDDLRPHGKIYGCNALYRDFTPDVLVSTDKPISETIQNSGYAVNNLMYTRNVIPGLGAYRIPDSYFGYSSGPIALALAADSDHSAIYIIGFDMGPDAVGRFNNVYADTEFYKKSSSTPTYSGNWARQMATVMKEHRRKSFIRVQGPTTATVQEFNKIGNLLHMSLPEFLDRVKSSQL